MDNTKLSRLISNYYKGELVSLAFKFLSALFIVGAVLAVNQYYRTDFMDLFSKNIFVIYGVIIAKSIYQLIQYHYRKKSILLTEPIDFDLEMDYIKKREAILTNHRRFHVYSLVVFFVASIIGLILFREEIQVLAILLSVLLLSSMLLSFSLFNSFRLSEYKRMMQGIGLYS